MQETGCTAILTLRGDMRNPIDRKLGRVNYAEYQQLYRSDGENVD